MAIDIEFMQLYKRNRIEPVSLPSHLSHVLQLFNLSVLSPLKTKYRGNIAALASLAALAYLEDAAPMKKQQLI